MSYELRVYYPSEYYDRFDTIIKKALKKDSEGSGMGFGERDLSFAYRTLPVALKAFQALNKLRLIARITLEKSYRDE